MSNATESLKSRNVNEYIEAVMLVASWVVVGSAAYLRGLLDGSSMTAVEFSEYTAQNGPLWPLAAFIIGMVVVGGSLIALWRCHE